MPKLVILSGAGKGLEYDIEKDAVLGRQGDNCIPIPDPKVSRQHTRIFCRNNSYYIEDLGSCNGTTVNAKNITCQPLVFGDRIAIGDTMIVFWNDGKGEPDYRDGAGLRPTSNQNRDMANRRQAENQDVTDRRQTIVEVKVPKSSIGSGSLSMISSDIKIKSTGAKSKLHLRTSRQKNETYGVLQPFFSRHPFIYKVAMIIFIFNFMTLLMFISRWLTLWLLE